MKVGIVVLKEGKILMQKNRGKWGIPRIIPRKGESDIKAIFRFFRENQFYTRIESIRYIDLFINNNYAEEVYFVRANKIETDRMVLVDRNIGEMEEITQKVIEYLSDRCYI